MFQSRIHHKTWLHLNDSNLALVLKHTQGMHWTSSRFRFTVRKEERWTFKDLRAVVVKWLQSFALTYSWAILPPSVFGAFLFLPVSCFHIHTYYTGMSKCLRGPCRRIPAACYWGCQKALRPTTEVRMCVKSHEPLPLVRRKTTTHLFYMFIFLLILSVCNTTAEAYNKNIFSYCLTLA